MKKQHLLLPILAALAMVAAITALSGVIQMYVLGWNSNLCFADSDSIQVSDSRVTMQVTTWSSAEILTRYKHTYRDGILTVQVRAVMAGGITAGEGAILVEIDDDFSGLREIVLEGDDRTRTVWEAP